MKQQKQPVRQTFLDRAITYLSPERGRRRYQERVILDFIKQRDYSAADRGRRTGGWNPRTGQSANALLSKSLPLIRERARDAVRNNPWGASMRSEIVSNLIHYGIIASFSNRDDEDADEDIPDIWLDWAETFQCDAAGRKNFYDIQKLVAGTWFESGECFIRRVWRDDWKPGEIPFALQVLEPEFIDHSHDGRDNTKLGIKFDSNGRRIGYWMFKKHPGEAVQNESFFADAADVIHVFSEDRPGQIRGIPMMAPVILRMYNLDLFEDAELTKQEIASMFAAFEKDGDPTMRQPPPDEEGEGKGGGMTIDDIQPGVIQKLGPGRDMVFSNPPQRQGYAEYVKQNLMAIAAGVGLTYENMSGDYGRVTFLNGRMGQLRFFRKIDQWQWMMLIPQLCDGVTRWFREGAAIAGHDMSRFVIEWQPPVKQMVDPEREANAEEHLVRMGGKTQFELIRGQGHDPVRFLKQRKWEQELMDKMGIVLTTDVRKVSGAGQMQAQGKTTGVETGDGDDSKEDGKEESEENSKK